MKKKLLSLLMAVAMIATLAVPAFASETPVSSKQEDLTYTGTTAFPAVTVTVHGTPALALNPYGMAVETKVISGGSLVSGDSLAQVVAPSIYLENKTEAPMKFGVKATATTKGNAQLSAKPCTGKETTRTAFLIAEFQQSATVDNPTWIADWSTTAKINETINEKCYPQIIPTADGKNAAALYSIDRATVSGGTVIPNYVMTKVSGNLAGNPTDAWTKADTVDLTMEFTFTVGMANAVTIDGSGVTLTDAAFHSNEYVMGATVRLNGPNDKTPTATDINGTSISVTKGPKDGLYYFVMPATAVTVKPGT